MIDVKGANQTKIYNQLSLYYNFVYPGFYFEELVKKIMFTYKEICSLVVLYHWNFNSEFYFSITS